MVSSPTANRSSASGEKTACSSRSASGRRAAAQSSLSRPASRAIVSQSEWPLAAKELPCSVDRALDLGGAMGGRDEHRLELRRRDVHAALEQMAEKLAIALGVRPLREREV